MGKVLVAARIENLSDLFKVHEGNLAPDAVRLVDVAEALVDTGATLLHIPERLIQQLHLSRVRTRRVRTTAGIVDVAIYDTVRLTIQGRDCIVEVAAVPDDCPVLVGQLPLEGLDFVVDPCGLRLIGNPEHGGEHMIEAFSTSGFQPDSGANPCAGSR
jgi:predicted aspartyl protease